MNKNVCQLVLLLSLAAVVGYVLSAVVFSVIPIATSPGQTIGGADRVDGRRSAEKDVEDGRSVLTVSNENTAATEKKEDVSTVMAAFEPPEGEDPERVKAEAAWNDVLARIESMQERGDRPSKRDIAAFKAAFDGFSEDEKAMQIGRANIVLGDSSVKCLEAILYDANEPSDVLSLVLTELCNRDNQIKIPVLKWLSARKSHPLSSDAVQILADAE